MTTCQEINCYHIGLCGLNHMLSVKLSSREGPGLLHKGKQMSWTIGRIWTWSIWVREDCDASRVVFIKHRWQIWTIPTEENCVNNRCMYPASHLSSPFGNPMAHHVLNWIHSMTIKIIPPCSFDGRKCYAQPTTHPTTHFLFFFLTHCFSFSPSQSWVNLVVTLFPGFNGIA